MCCLQQKIEFFPRNCSEEIHAFLEQSSNKVKTSSSNTRPKMKVTPRLAEGKWKYPKDIHAIDDDVEDMFEIYL